MDRREVVVNRQYQRSDRVWPSAARSFLIESLLLGFPMPKVYLHAKTDLKTRQTVKEIIDGQQRSRAIHDYFHDRFPLSQRLETEEVRGRRYSELEPEWQSRFLTYPISLDLFVSATAQEVQEIFRRLNSYTIPLNPEELRHARFQGEFKWAIYGLSRRYWTVFLNNAIFTEKGLVRMQDTKLLTEVSHAVQNGIATTNKTTLDAMYRKYDDDVEGTKRIYDRLSRTLDQLASFDFLKELDLARPHIVYSLMVTLANNHEPIPGLERPALVDLSDVVEVERRLAELGEAMVLDEEGLKESPWRRFVVSSSSRTNVREQREARVQAIQDALTA